MKGTSETRENLVSSIHLDPDDLEEHQRRMEAKYIRAQQSETRFEQYATDDAELLLVGYGIVSRVLRSAVEQGAKARAARSVCSVRLRSWPYPSKDLARIASGAHEVSGR